MAQDAAAYAGGDEVGDNAVCSRLGYSFLAPGFPTGMTPCTEEGSTWRGSFLNSPFLWVLDLLAPPAPSPRLFRDFGLFTHQERGVSAR